MNLKLKIFWLCFLCVCVLERERKIEIEIDRLRQLMGVATPWDQGLNSGL